MGLPFFLNFYEVFKIYMTLNYAGNCTGDGEGDTIGDGSGDGKGNVNPFCKQNICRVCI